MHTWDENVYLQNAELMCCGKNNYNEIDSRPPLLSLLFAGVFLLWHSDYAAYVVTALLNALGPVVLYLAGRMIVGRAAAAIAALLLAFTPFFVSVFPPVSSGFVSFPTGHSLLTDSPALTADPARVLAVAAGAGKRDGAAVCGGGICAGNDGADAVSVAGECGCAFVAYAGGDKEGAGDAGVGRGVRCGGGAVFDLVAIAVWRIPGDVSQWLETTSTAPGSRPGFI